MNAPQEDSMTPVKRALLEIRELRERLGKAQSQQREPIAIVGMSFKLPGGVGDSAALSRLLWSGVDAVTEIPAQRWSLDELYAADPETPGKMTTRYGAFLDGVENFDAEFFGISPREAASMDPQQRLLLETAWAALENAGQSPATLAGSRTGVYLGISNNDYGRALYAHRELIDAYFSTGNAYSVAAGRLSYLLGLQGPSVAIDTACSSSLVALHLACQSLRLRECDRALVGGVNLILTPEMNINFSKANMMAPDGRCKTFDAAADGYVRGEGCVMLALRRLDEALAAGERVLAVIRGSAINQDGRSGGLTAPNGPAQEAVIRAALEAAQVPAGDIGYVEAHGTGTPLGDPIEVGAIGAVLCAGRDSAQPLLIGSVKTNIGHLEAAAGLAGLVKVVLGLQRREIPPHLHFRRGNPHIDWDSLAIAVPTEVTAWPVIGGRRLAGVSSFGFSGTNAHVIVEEAPSVAVAPHRLDRPVHVLTLSARDEAGLQELARRYESQLLPAANPTHAVAAQNADAAGAAPDVGDLCFTANAGRSHFNHRLAVIGADADELRHRLHEFGAGDSNAALLAGWRDGASRPQVAFLFTGQGAQYAGMGRLLYDTSPVFRHALDACAAGLEPYLRPGLLEVIFAAGATTPLNETAYAQPATFAIEYALAMLWRSWGIEPVAVLGHSLGEYAAACVAGLLSLEDALRVVAERGRITHALPAGGSMAAVFADESVVASQLTHGDGQVWIAAYNGPEHVVISGATAAVQAVIDRLAGEGVRVKLLRVPHAAHSPLIEPALPALRKAVESVRFFEPTIALISNVSGAFASLAEVGHPDYWVAHMRQPVRFTQSIQALAAQGITHFIEVGPHPVLLGMGAECLPGGKHEWLPSLHRDRPDWSDLLESLQHLYVAGSDVNWTGFDQPYARRRVDLPTYPFRRRRHWMEVVGQPAVAALSAGERWTRIARALQRQAERGPLDLNASSYTAKWDCLARLTAAHAIRTLRDAGLFTMADERHSLDEVLSTAGIAVTYRHLVQRWLQRLVAQDLLFVDGLFYTAKRALPDPGLAALWEEAQARFADNSQLLAYVRHCGDLLGAVLTGAESPLETLFPGGSFELAEDLYQRSTTMRYVNDLAAAAMQALSESMPAGRVLRVLEVGAGTGGTSAALLPVLEPERTRYRFTDVSEFFLERAQRQFANHPFIDYGLFDMERDPAAQGYAAHSFDVIVSANAVHASTDLRLALRRLHELLAPGGVLLLVESTTHLAWFDMTTGLIEGWQHFADDLRTDNPLLSSAVWTQALSDAGFEMAAAWPAEGSAAESLGQHVLVARVAGEADAVVEAADVPSGSVIRQSAATVALEQAAVFKQLLRDALPADRLELVRGFVRERVMRVLRLSAADEPGRNERLMDLGFDSLMAVQLRNLLSGGLGLDKPLPATVMFDYPTIDALAAHLLERMAPPVDAEASVTAAPGLAHPVLGAAAVAAMSDEQIEALLMERLGRP